MRNWKYINGAEIGNSIPDSQINGPSGAEIREIAGRVYKTDMRKDDLARAVSFELAKKYKSFQTNSHIMDMVSEVLSKFKIGNETMHEWATSKPKNVGNYSKGQSLGESGGRKYVYGGEINGTHIVYVQPGGTSYTFSSEQEIKDWLRSSHIGNAKVINSDREFFKELADDAKKEEKKYDADIEKVGNKEYSTDDFKRIKEEALRIARTTKDEEKKKRALKIADYMKYAHNQPDWGKIVDRYDQELKQIGNSAQDDKFAYVMREFDEGKLKTPDGKVVTDPAQAKAIAYSESKKAENGLARARNAMKCGNKEKTFQREYTVEGHKIKEVVTVRGNTLPAWIEKAASSDKNVFATAIEGGLPNSTYEMYRDGALVTKKQH